MSKLLIILVVIFIGFATGTATAQNPHILVNAGEKQAVLDKIKQQVWAKSIFEEIQNEVNPYVERHVTNPDWILSRYLMNRIPGKRYTTVFADESGSRLIKWAGDAPVPTIRVSTYLRSPITEKGASYRKPTIDELIPNDTSRVMELLNPETGQKDWIDPQAYITDINGDINDLALESVGQRCFLPGTHCWPMPNRIT